MFRRAHRIVLVLIALLSLSLPLAGQVRSDRDGRTGESFLSRLWQRLVSPVTALWAGDTAPNADPQPVPPATDPGVTTDGRSMVDPLG